MNKLSKLVDKYPSLYGDQFYFECADGWFDLLDTLSFHIINELKPGDEINVAQIKEKFGTLRFYYSCRSESYNSIASAVMFAERFSAKICEDCGNSGRVRRGGWIRTLCDQCVKTNEETTLIP